MRFDGVAAKRCNHAGNPIAEHISMKTNSLFHILGLSAALLCLAAAASAQTLLRFESQPGSKMRMDGTSTIHA